MAVRSDGSQGYTRTTNLPSITLFTAMFWSKMVTELGGISTFFKFGGTSGSGGYRIGSNPPGTQVFIKSEGHTSVGGSTLTLGRWYHKTIVVDSSGGRLYLDGKLDASIAVTTGSAGEMCVAWWGEAAGENCDAVRAAFKCWSGIALTVQQIQREMVQYRPVIWQGLNTFSPFRNVNEQSYNLAVDNNNWDVTNTFTEEAGPPGISWEFEPRKKVYFFVGGAVITPLSLSSSVTPVSSVVKLVNKSIGSGVTPVSTVVKRGNKVLSSSVIPTTAVFLVTRKVLASSVTPVSTVVKKINKNLSSLAVVTSSLSKVVVKAPFGSSVTPISFLSKVGIKVLGSVVTPTTTVVTSVIKVLLLSSSVTPVTTLVKLVNKNLNSSVPMATTVVKVIVKSFSSGVIPVSAVVKVVSKVLGSVVTPTTTLVQSAIKALVLSSVVTPVSSIVKVVSKGLLSEVTPITSITKLITKAFGSQVTPTSQLVKMYVQYVVLDSFVTPVTSIVTQFISGSGFVANSLLPWLRRRRRK